MTLSLSKIILAFAMCLVVGMAKCSGQSRRCFKQAIADRKALYLAETNPAIREIDSIDWEQWKMAFWLKKHPNACCPPYDTGSDTHGSYVIKRKKHYLPQQIKTAL